MITAFNTAVSALSGFFSKLFWFGTFLPVAVFAVIHLALVMHAFPALGITLPAAAVTDGNWPLAVLGVIVLSFALAPLNPLFRGCLDGYLLPVWLHDWLRRRRMRRGIQERRQSENALARLEEAILLRETLGGSLQTAYDNATTRRTAADATVLKAAGDAVDAAWSALEKGGLPGVEPTETAVNKTVAALAVNSPNTRSVPQTDGDRAIQTFGVHKLAVDLLEAAEAEARYRFDTEEARRRGTPFGAVLRATRMGDARYSAERYSDRVYGVSFDFLWPRLLLVLPQRESALADRLVNAQAQLDFVVMSLALSATLFLWLPMLALWGNSVLIFLLLAVLAPLAIRGLYALAVESQLRFGEVIKSAVDRHRLDVLKDLGHPLPSTRLAERNLWSRIQDAEQASWIAELPYAPKAPA